MANNYLRIDDRLIHGQIITAWCSFWDIGEIIAIDDKLASNPALRGIMLMGVPSTYKAQIVTVGEAKELFNKESERNRIFITRFPATLLSFREELQKCETVVIGNVAKRPDTKYNLSDGGGSVFYVSDEDIAVFDEAEKDGVNLIYQTVPKSTEKSWSEMRKLI